PTSFPARTWSIMSSSIQPPETEPTTMPSSRIAVRAPIGRGAEPHVWVTVTITTRRPALTQSRALFSTWRSTLSMAGFRVRIRGLYFTEYNGQAHGRNGCGAASYPRQRGGPRFQPRAVAPLWALS